MSDNNDQINLEDDKTLDGSQPEQKDDSQDSDESQPSKPDVKKVEDKVLDEWSTMSGSTQDRIRQLIKERNDLRDLNSNLRQSFNKPADPKPEKTDGEMTADEALEKLSSAGVATQDFVNRSIGQIYINQDHSRLEGKYDGSNNLPKYVREEVEDYARSNGFGANFEAAFKQMYFDEFVDAAKGKSTPKQPYTEKPTSSVRIGEKPLTLESLKERLKKPDGPAWWQKNREKIEPLLGKLTQEA